MKKRNGWLLLLAFALAFGVFTWTISAASVKTYAATADSNQSGTDSTDESAIDVTPTSEPEKTGWVTEKGYKYYYNKKGEKLTGLQTISKKTYYFDSRGRLVVSKHGIKIGKNYYKINSKGVATKLTEVEGLAGIQVDKLAGKVTDKNKLLKKAFDWSKKLKYRNLKKVNKNAAQYYGLYGFKNNRGDCYVQAATFYWMAKSIGFSGMIYVEGIVPSPKGVRQPHGWVERKVGKKYYFFDPNSAGDKKSETTYNFLYGTPGSFEYNDSHHHKVQYKK